MVAGSLFREFRTAGAVDGLIVGDAPTAGVCGRETPTALVGAPVVAALDAPAAVVLLLAEERGANSAGGCEGRGNRVC